MSIQASFTFFGGSVNELTWSVQTDGVVVNNATVTATLYWNRDRVNPDLVPGEAVAGFTGLALVFDVGTSLYTKSIPATFNPPTGGNYVLVVDVKDLGGNELGHYERPAVVLKGGS